jgi:hypothetical protein
MSSKPSECTELSTKYQQLSQLYGALKLSSSEFIQKPEVFDTHSFNLLVTGFDNEVTPFSEKLKEEAFDIVSKWCPLTDIQRSYFFQGLTQDKFGRVSLVINTLKLKNCNYFPTLIKKVTGQIAVIDGTVDTIAGLEEIDTAFMLKKSSTDGLDFSMPDLKKIYSGEYGSSLIIDAQGTINLPKLVEGGIIRSQDAHTLSMPQLQSGEIETDANTLHVPRLSSSRRIFATHLVEAHFPALSSVDEKLVLPNASVIEASHLKHVGEAVVATMLSRSVSIVETFKDLEFVGTDRGGYSFYVNCEKHRTELQALRDTANSKLRFDGEIEIGDPLWLRT